MATAFESYSDLTMACPSDVENGLKLPWIKRAGAAVRRASDRRTGEWTGPTYDTEFKDVGAHFRQQLADPNRDWRGAHVVKMTTRANRAVKGDWYTAFTGPLLEAQPVAPRGIRLTLSDLVGSLVGSDRGDSPYRVIGDGMLGELTSVYEHLDKSGAEPTIYGQHRRVPDIDVASQYGFCVLPIYLGIMDVSATAYHVWLIAGHACADIPTWRVDTTDKSADEGSQWMVPHWPAWTSEFGAPYVDYVDRFGITRRYTLILGKVTDMFADEADLTDPDACALGRRQLTVAVDGVEPVGDGSEDAIVDRVQQYKHWFRNYVAHRGADSYMSGDWLTTPTWNAYGPTVPMIDEQSFDDCSAIWELRLPATEETVAGAIGALVIGAGGERASVTTWVAIWNRSCDVQSTVTRFGQWRIFMVSPTDVIKAAAPFYHDVRDILVGSFGTSIAWPKQATRIPFQGDKNPATGVYTTTDSAWVAAAEEKTSDTLDYPAAPGITALNAIAQAELRRSRDLERLVSLRTRVGPDTRGDSLAYREVGDYFRYRHYSAVATSTSQIRLAQIVALGVDVGTREVIAEAVDVEDLIGYDRPADT